MFGEGLVLVTSGDISCFRQSGSGCRDSEGGDSGRAGGWQNGKRMANVNGTTNLRVKCQETEKKKSERPCNRLTDADAKRRRVESFNLAPDAGQRSTPNIKESHRSPWRSSGVPSGCVQWRSRMSRGWPWPRPGCHWWGTAGTKSEDDEQGLAIRVKWASKKKKLKAGFPHLKWRVWNLKRKEKIRKDYFRVGFLPAPSCCWRRSRMSPADTGDDRTRSPDVAWLQKSDPFSSVSWGRLRCPESPRCADSSPDHLRGRRGRRGQMFTCDVSVHRPLKFF